ncbi:hypothetical protein [Lysinibacillus agricola]
MRVPKTLHKQLVQEA